LNPTGDVMLRPTKEIWDDIRYAQVWWAVMRSGNHSMLLSERNQYIEQDFILSLCYVFWNQFRELYPRLHGRLPGVCDDYRIIRKPSLHLWQKELLAKINSDIQAKKNLSLELLKSHLEKVITAASSKLEAVIEQEKHWASLKEELFTLKEKCLEKALPATVKRVDEAFIQLMGNLDKDAQNQYRRLKKTLLKFISEQKEQKITLKKHINDSATKYSKACSKQFGGDLSKMMFGALKEDTDLVPSSLCQLPKEALNAQAEMVKSLDVAVALPPKEQLVRFITALTEESEAVAKLHHQIVTAQKRKITQWKESHYAEVGAWRVAAKKTGIDFLKRYDEAKLAIDAQMVSKLKDSDALLRTFNDEALTESVSDALKKDLSSWQLRAKGSIHHARDAYDKNALLVKEAINQAEGQTHSTYRVVRDSLREVESLSLEDFSKKESIEWPALWTLETEQMDRALKALSKAKLQQPTIPSKTYYERLFYQVGQQLISRAQGLNGDESLMSMQSLIEQLPQVSSSVESIDESLPMRFNQWMFEPLQQVAQAIGAKQEKAAHTFGKRLLSLKERQQMVKLGLSQGLNRGLEADITHQLTILNLMDKAMLACGGNGSLEPLIQLKHLSERWFSVFLDANPLHLAVDAHHGAATALLLAYGADKNQVHEVLKETPLSLADKLWPEESPVRLTLQNKTLPGHYHLPEAMVLAAKVDDAVMIAKLIKHGFSVFAVNQKGECALTVAVRHNSLSVLQYLKAEVGPFKSQIAHLLAHTPTPLTMKLLSQLVHSQTMVRVSEPDIFMDRAQRTPLMLMAAQGDVIGMDCLVEKGHSLVNASDAEEKTPLMYACQSGNLEAVIYLLERRADPYHMGYSGSVIRAAILSNVPEIVNVVLTNFRQLAHQRTKDLQETPLMMAVKQKEDGTFVKSIIIELLIVAGSDLEATNLIGKTALAIASMHGNTSAVDVLLKYGADKQHLHAKEHGLGRLVAFSDFPATYSPSKTLLDGVKLSKERLALDVPLCQDKDLPILTEMYIKHMQGPVRDYCLSELEPVEAYQRLQSVLKQVQAALLMNEPVSLPKPTSLASIVQTETPLVRFSNLLQHTLKTYQHEEVLMLEQGGMEALTYLLEQLSSLTVMAAQLDKEALKLEEVVVTDESVPEVMSETVVVELLDDSAVKQKRSLQEQKKKLEKEVQALSHALNSWDDSLTAAKVQLTKETTKIQGTIEQSSKLQDLLAVSEVLQKKKTSSTEDVASLFEMVELTDGHKLKSKDSSSIQLPTLGKVLAEMVPHQKKTTEDKPLWQKTLGKVGEQVAGWLEKHPKIISILEYAAKAEELQKEIDEQHLLGGVVTQSLQQAESRLEDIPDALSGLPAMLSLDSNESLGFMSLIGMAGFITNGKTKPQFKSLLKTLMPNSASIRVKGLNKIKPYGMMDIEGKIKKGKIPQEYLMCLADQRLVVEMPFVKGTGKKQNSLGYARNPKYYWESLYKRHPEAFSVENLQRIKKREFRKIENDKTFYGVFKQYDHPSLHENRLVHHHIAGGSQAVALPKELHKGSGDIHTVEKVMGVWHIEGRSLDISSKAPGNSKLSLGIGLGLGLTSMGLLSDTAEAVQKVTYQTGLNIKPLSLIPDGGIGFTGFDIFDAPSFKSAGLSDNVQLSSQLLTQPDALRLKAPTKLSIQPLFKLETPRFEFVSKDLLNVSFKPSRILDRETVKTTSSVVPVETSMTLPSSSFMPSFEQHRAIPTHEIHRPTIDFSQFTADINFSTQSIDVSQVNASGFIFTGGSRLNTKF